MDRCRVCGAEITEAIRPKPSAARGHNKGKCGPCISKWHKKVALWGVGAFLVVGMVGSLLEGGSKPEAQPQKEEGSKVPSVPLEQGLTSWPMDEGVKGKLKDALGTGWSSLADVHTDSPPVRLDSFRSSTCPELGITLASVITQEGEKYEFATLILAGDYEARGQRSKEHRASLSDLDPKEKREADVAYRVSEREISQQAFLKHSELVSKVYKACTGRPSETADLLDDLRKPVDRGRNGRWNPEQVLTRDNLPEDGYVRPEVLEALKAGRWVLSKASLRDVDGINLKFEWVRLRGAVRP